MKYIQIENDKWEDLNRTYRVLEYVREDLPKDTSRVDLTLQKEDGTIDFRTVAYHQIKWIFNY
jgi:hypothetical protein